MGMSYQEHKLWMLGTLLVVGLLPAFNASAQPLPGDLDGDLPEVVESDLAADDAIPAHRIDVDVNLGVVTLAGTVDTLFAKQRAVMLVERLKGVRAIVNRITVQPSKRTDEQILEDAKRALRDDPVADADKLRVQVHEGVVTLEGEVDSYAAAQLAGNALAGVRGVSELENKITVVAKEDRADDEIRSEIMGRFASDPWLAQGLMDVEVNDGDVALTGIVGSLREKRIANVLAWVAGVRAVDDSDLEIKWWLRREMWRGDKTAVRSDLQITQAVNDAMLYDPRLRGANVNVRSRWGVVTLLGRVATLSAKRAAGQDAKNTLGVNRVKNHLKVRPEEWPGDAAISERVRASLSRDAHLLDTDISSASHFGKLYLDGTVDSRFQKERAEAVAANLPGVLEVVNRLDINHPEVTKPDREIQQDIARRFQSHSLLGNDPIDVSVSDGTATLKGVIDTFQQRSLMENMALRAGALRVRSDLVVRSGRKAMAGLVAELVNFQDVYELDSERSGKLFRDVLQAANQNPRLQDRLPPAPEVNLVLRLHNQGTEPAEVRVDHDLTEIELGLTGKGAVHVSLRRDFVAVFRPGRVVVIQPGDDYEIPIDSLQYGFRNAAERWYWTQPGDYKLQATFTWPTDASGFFQHAVTTKPIPLTVNSD